MDATAIVVLVVLLSLLLLACYSWWRLQRHTQKRRAAVKALCSQISQISITTQPTVHQSAGRVVEAPKVGEGTAGMERRKRQRKLAMRLTKGSMKDIGTPKEVLDAAFAAVEELRYFANTIPPKPTLYLSLIHI